MTLSPSLFRKKNRMKLRKIISEIKVEGKRHPTPPSRLGFSLFANFLFFLACQGILDECPLLKKKRCYVPGS